MKGLGLGLGLTLNPSLRPLTATELRAVAAAVGAEDAAHERKGWGVQSMPYIDPNLIQKPMLHCFYETQKIGRVDKKKSK